MSWIRYILVPVTRIELGGSNGEIWSEENVSTILRKMAQPETDGVRTTEDEGNMLETPSDDEVIQYPLKKGKIYYPWRTFRNYTTRRLATTYGAQTWDTPATDWCTLRQRRTQFSRRRQIYHPPFDIGMGPSVCRQEDGLIWKRKFAHLRGGGGHQAPEPQDVQSEACVGPKTVPEDNVRE